MSLSQASIANPPQDLATPTEPRLVNVWNQAQDNFKRTLSTSQYQKFLAVGNSEQLLQEVSNLNITYRKRLIPRVLSRLDPFFQQLKLFGQTITILIQSNPRITSVIWGSIYALLEAALLHQNHLEEIVQVLEYVGKHLPRIESFADLFVISKRIEKAVCDLYYDLIQFSFQAIVFLNRNPLANLLAVVLCTRKGFQREFTEQINSIRDHTQWIDSEANVGLHLVAHQLTSRGHHEILASISAIASPIIMASPASGSHRIIPYIENSSFFGREDELRSLDDVLVPYRKSRLSIFSVVGEGGVGKSQLALQFAYSHFSEFSTIFWIPADTSFKMERAYEEFALEVGLIQKSGDQESLSTVRETVKKWLRTTDHIWLLIFDNVESMTSLDDYWPTGGHGSVVITTRNQNLMQSPISTSLVLRCFTIEEGTCFILSNVSATVKNAKEARLNAAQICSACGGLPLALSQVIRYIRSLNTSLADARKLCSTPELLVNANSEINQLNQPDYYHQLNISMLWKQPLQSLHPNCEILVKYLAHLDPDGIPEEFLKLDWDAGIQAHFESTTEINGHVLTLLERSLLSRGTKSGTYSMHRLIQATILNQLNNDERTSLFKVALNVVDALFPDYDDSDRLLHSWPLCSLILPHVVRLKDLFSSSSFQYDNLIYFKLGQIFERASWYLQERGVYNTAMRLLRGALDATQKGIQITAAPTHDLHSQMSTSHLLQNLKKLFCDITNTFGVLELRRSNFDMALQYFLEASTMRNQLVQTIDEELIYMKRNTGIAYLSANRIDEAFAAFEDSLALREQKLAKADDRHLYRDNLASNYRSLSYALMAMQRLDEAWDAAMKSTDLCKQVHSAESAILAECYTALGKIRFSQGRLDDAEPLFLKALDIRTQFYGQHEHTSLALHNYAMIAKQKGQIREAISDIKQAVRILRKLPDAKHLLARELFYLSIYKMELGDDTNRSDRDEAFKLYYEHVQNVVKDPSSLSIEDFDNLLVHYHR